MELLLPSRIHTIRQVVDAAFQQASLQPRVIGEVESVLTLVSAVGADLGRRCCRGRRRARSSTCRTWWCAGS